MVEIEQSAKEYTSLKKLLQIISLLNDQIMKQDPWAYLHPTRRGIGVCELGRQLHCGVVSSIAVLSVGVVFRT
ncbi:hypothetical protein LINPERPRIM_LOCUS13978 [Linum perenne]